MSVVLITGSGGQLGKALVKYLANKNLNIISTAYKSNPDNTLLLDISKKHDVIKILKKFDPDVIINCAAYTNVDANENNKEEAYRVNVQGVKYLMNFSKSSCYFIQISTDYVFDGKNGPYSENDYTYPINYYGKTKLEAENILRGSRKRTLIIRVNTLYSDNLLIKSNFFAWIYNSLYTETAISVVNDQISNPTEIKQIMNLILKCILVKYEGILHCGSQDFISRYDFSLLVAKTFNLNESFIIPIKTKTLMENNINYKAKRPIASGLLTEKIEKEFDFPVNTTEYNLSKYVIV